MTKDVRNPEVKDEDSEAEFELMFVEETRVYFRKERREDEESIAGDDDDYTPIHYPPLKKRTLSCKIPNPFDDMDF